MVQKSENQSQKKTVDTVNKKRPKKAKIKGQNSCFNSVDNLHRHLNKKKGLKSENKGPKLSFRSVDSNKLTKNRTKKAKMRARKAVDTVDKKKT